MNIWHDISPARITVEEFCAVVEIPKGSKNKYELDHETGLLRLDRVLFTATHYPANYGFIPRTLAEDDDPLDVMILCSESIGPMTLVESKPIGVLKMIDQGAVDEKIIAVCAHDPFYNKYKDIADLPTHVFEEIRHFYAVYKTLENKDTLVKEILGLSEAKAIIAKAIAAYLKEYSL